MVDRDPRALAERYGPHGVLALAFAFMFWVRMRPVDRIITESAVYFSGNDPWYHRRMVNLAVRHFPGTTQFDPWSYFPYGTGHHSGFGGLFDQLIALAALIVGLGDPSPHTVDVVTAVAPAVFGALTAIPTYVITRRITGRWAALASAGILALLSGGILTRTVVGSADHQAAEALFGAVAVVGFAFAIAVAYREQPTMEDVLDRNWEFLRGPAIAGVLGGVAIASYLALWSPGVMLLFTFGVFVVLQLSRDHVGERSTEPLTFATVTSMATVGVLMLLYARTYEITEGDFSLLQPLVAFGLVVGALVLYLLSDRLDREGYDRWYYPLGVVALIGVAIVGAWIVYPRSIDLLIQLVERIYSFGLLTSPSALTVQEIRPATLDDAFRAFGVVFALALLGLLLMGYHVVRENRPIELLVVLWSVTMLSAYFTMIRFGYYLAVNVAVLSTFAIWWATKRWLHLDVDFDLDRIRAIELYQVIGLLVILMLIVPGNVVAMSGRQPVWETSERLGGTDLAWYDGLDWMEGNTPPIEMDYYGQYERPPDGDYAYPESAYGVMSWWDYGHWITTIANRIPYANPFQQGQIASSRFLQTSNETTANLLLDVQPALESSDQVGGMTTDELAAAADGRTDQQVGEDGRYVVIDDQMAGGKFSAIATWTGPGSAAYFTRSPYQIQGQNVTLPAPNQRYDRTMLAELYYDDASGLSHYRLVHEVDRYSLVGGYVQGQRVNPLTSLQLNGNWESLRGTANQIQSVKGTNQVVQIGPGSFAYDAEVESRVKIYERVEGATITGTTTDVEDGTPVFAFLNLRTSTGRNVTYIQQTQVGPDGSFEMTVPYATDDAVGPADGGTNTSVRATEEYTVVVGSPFSASATGMTEVPEQAVYQGQTIQVDLEATASDDGSEGNQTAGTANESTGSLGPVGISAGP